MAHPLPRPAGAPAFDPRVPFSREDAREAGISLRQLTGPGYERILHDRYVSSAVEITDVMRAETVLQLCDPDGHVSHFTAARLWGAWVPDDSDIHLSVPRGGARSRRRGVRMHVTNPAAAVVRRHGLPISSPEQTFLDLAGTLALVDLVVLGDSLLRAGHTTTEKLIACADAWRGHGAVLARRAARLVRTGVDSRMETRLRLLIVLAGLPEPVVNHVFTHEDGRWKLRLDLAYPQWRLAIEYDGRQHAESDRQWQRDIDRRELLDRIDFRLIVVRAPGLFVDPLGTLTRIVDALADRGVRLTIRGDEWRRHFPARAAVA